MSFPFSLLLEDSIYLCVLVLFLLKFQKSPACEIFELPEGEKPEKVLSFLRTTLTEWTKDNRLGGTLA